jgi:hypothetical protein
MAQQNYEVFVKSGVKISQSEVDRDSKEITNLVNKEIIERYVPEGKKISKKLYQEYIKKSSTELLENIPKRQKQAAKEYFDKTSKIIENNFLNVIDNLTILISEISFLEKNKAKVRLVSNSKDIDDFDTDEILDEAFEKANISYKEMDNIEKMSKAKLDNFYKYLDEKFKEKLNDLDYVETYSEIEVKKINGKWELEYDFNTYLNEITNGFNTNDD